MDGIDTPSRELAEQDLNQFTGTQCYYRHRLTGFKYTEGVQYMAENGGAYWLVDKILLSMKYVKKCQKQQEFAVWKLTINDDYSAILVLEDGNKNKLFTEKIEYTDFPIHNIAVWFIDGVLILPSEY